MDKIAGEGVAGNFPVELQGHARYNKPHVCHLSTEEKEAGENPWVSEEKEDPGRQENHYEKASQGQGTYRGLMLTKKFRLPIQAFPRQARAVFRDKYLTIKVSPNSAGHSRVGVVLSKANVKQPVKRNLLRRRILDFFRLEKKFIESRNVLGTDLLLILNPAIMELTKEELWIELKDYGKFV